MKFRVRANYPRLRSSDLCFGDLGSISIAAAQRPFFRSVGNACREIIPSPAFDSHEP